MQISGLNEHRYLPEAVEVAEIFSRKWKGPDSDDLAQELAIEAVHFIDRYDKAGGASFKNALRWRMSGGIVDFSRDQLRDQGVSTLAARNYSAILDNPEVEQDFIMRDMVTRPYERIDAPVSDVEVENLHGTLATDNGQTAEDQALETTAEKLWAELREAGFQDDEVDMLTKFYEGYCGREIGEMYGITEGRVSQRVKDIRVAARNILEGTNQD